MFFIFSVTQVSPLLTLVFFVRMKALLKIIKHCKGSSPANVTGSLLGLNVGGRLEVTNCFPFPTSGDAQDNDGCFNCCCFLGNPQSKGSNRFSLNYYFRIPNTNDEVSS